MYYKLKKGTPTFEKLDAVWVKMKECNAKAFDLVKELGFTKFAINSRGVAGGISCIQSNEKPEGWKSVGKEGQNLIYPKMNNKEVSDKIAALPIIYRKEYNETIGFKEQFSDTLYHGSFGSKKVDDIYLIEVSNECDYTPTDDMEEITFTEYKKLSINQKKEEDAAV